MKLTNNWQPYSIGLKLQRESWQMFGGLWSNKKKKANTAFVSLREYLENFPFEAAYAWFFTLSRWGYITQTHKVSI